MPYHFISGLPRSGSTLLAALLRQNPRFTAAMTSPVCGMFEVVHQNMCASEGRIFFDDARRGAVLRGLFDSYYASSRSGTVFDTNRAWTRYMPQIAVLFPGARVVCCVREVGWILNSIERMLNENPLQLSKIFNFERLPSVYMREESLMNRDGGLIGAAWMSLREAWYGAFAQRLLVLPYEELVRAPQEILRQLYIELEEPWFEHDFEHVQYDEQEFDTELGMPGLHRVQLKVRPLHRQPCIPQDLFGKYVSTQFWNNLDENVQGVRVLRVSNKTGR